MRPTWLLLLLLTIGGALAHSDRFRNAVWRVVFTPEEVRTLTERMARAFGEASSTVTEGGTVLAQCWGEKDCFPTQGLPLVFHCADGCENAVQLCPEGCGGDADCLNECQMATQLCQDRCDAALAKLQSKYPNM